MPDKRHHPSPGAERAVVVGASMAGLLAARVLADHFGEVMLLEQDVLGAGVEQRRGVPQGRHTHVLLVAGVRIMERFFPGLAVELTEAGAIRGDAARDVRWFLEGGMLRTSASGFDGFGMTRPLLESIVRTRVRAISNVRVCESTAVDGLAATPDRRRIVGVTIAGETLPATLIVNATGRSSRSAAWLGALGYGRPPEEKVHIDLRYTTRLFRRRPDDLDGFNAVIVPPPPLAKRGGAIFAQEGERWIVTLTTHFGDQPPPELPGFIEFARSLPAPDIYEVIRDAEPLDDAETTRFPASVRRSYQRLRRFPEGYLVIGDALSSFNPIYGQGMAVAALEAAALSDLLRDGRDGLPRRFFKRAAKIVDGPWLIAVGNDLRMPEAIGRRNGLLAVTNWYVPRLLRVGQRDASVARAFLEVTNLLAPPSRLMRPALLWQVMRALCARSL